MNTAQHKAAANQILARLSGGFSGTVTNRGVVFVSPPWPTLVGILPDGEEVEVSVRWPDERGSDNRPQVGTRVKVSPRGDIEIVAAGAVPA